MEQVLGQYQGNKLIVNGFDVNKEGHSQSDYDRYFTSVKLALSNNDLVQQRRENRLWAMYNQGVIDYPLLKALTYIKSYHIGNSEIKYRNIITHRQRKRLLFNHFALWYQRSCIKLPFDFIKRLVRKINEITIIQDNQLSEYVEQVLISKKYKIR